MDEFKLYDGKCCRYMQEKVKEINTQLQQPEDEKFRLKWIKQAREKGFCNNDVYNAFWAIAKFNYAVIKEFIPIQTGGPNEMTFEKWINILHCIKDGFYFWYKKDFLEDIIHDKYEFKKAELIINKWAKRANKGLKLFAEYFSSLWD